MTKKHFIELADIIKRGNAECVMIPMFDEHAISKLADFCAAQNYQFNRQRWLDYIDGKCTAHGGKIK